MRVFCRFVPHRVYNAVLNKKKKMHIFTHLYTFTIYIRLFKALNVKKNNCIYINLLRILWPDIVWSKTSSIITHQCIAIGSATNARSCRQLNFFSLVFPTVRGPFWVIRVPLDGELLVSVSHRVQIAFGKRPVRFLSVCEWRTLYQK